MASLSSRPLRQPPRKSTSSTPQYGRVVQTTNHKSGGSLPLIPTQQTTNLQSISASFVLGGPFHEVMGKGSSFSSGQTEPPQLDDPPVAQSDKIHRRPIRSSPKGTLRETKREPPLVKLEPHQRELKTARSTSACLLKQDAPGDGMDSKSLPNIIPRQARYQDEAISHRPQRVISGKSYPTGEMSESITGGRPHKEVRFNTVQVHNAEPGRPPTKAIDLDTYENERGPTRPPAFFLKSEAELRDVRRIRQIEDARADEEWQVIRDINTEIQADVEEKSPINSRVMDEHGLGISFQGAAKKKKKKWMLRSLFKKQPKPHPLADI